MPPTEEFPDGFHLIELGCVGSTNDEAKSMAEDGAADGTIVRAASQTAGRGRNGRIWVSEEGNLYFSLLVRPNCAAQTAVQLSFVTAIALAETLLDQLPAETGVTCKWPNDVLVGGKKIAGMLLETAPLGGGLLDWLVIGIGLNVASHPSDVMYPATSVHAAGATDTTADEVLADFCQRFARWRAVWMREGFGPVRERWVGLAAGLGEEICVRLASETQSGVFDGLDEHGALILLRGNGERMTITAGDVFFPAAH